MSRDRRAWGPVLLLTVGSLLFLVMGACSKAEPTVNQQPAPVAPVPAITAPVTSQEQSPQAETAPAPAPSPANPGAERDRFQEFSVSFSALTKEWDAFQNDYEKWRSGLTDCNEEAMRKALRQWAAQFSAEVTATVHQLRPPAPARPAAELLSDALATEELALRRLSDFWKPGTVQAFLEFEAARGEANKLRRKAVYALEEARSGGGTAAPTPAPSPDQKASEGAKSSKEAAGPKPPAPNSTSPVRPDPAVEAFVQPLSAANDLWDAFQRRYDSWRQRSGDCNSSEVTTALRTLFQRFQGIAAAARRLPYSPTVAPVTELLNQAVDVEEQALKLLRDTWQPYNLQYFTSFEERKADADRLRRQAATIMATLLS